MTEYFWQLLSVQTKEDRSKFATLNSIYKHCPVVSKQSMEFRTSTKLKDYFG